MNSIRDQLLSEDWKYWKKAYLDENVDKECFTCGADANLDLYIRKFHRDIEFIWNYPNSAFGVACFECRRIKMKALDEVKLRLGEWSTNELDLFLDVLDNIERSGGSRSIAVNKLYGYSKLIK